MAAFTAAAVKPISRSQRNGGFGADSGPSRGGPCKGAIHPKAGPQPTGHEPLLMGGLENFVPVVRYIS